jgi:hypothetical protein
MAGAGIGLCLGCANRRALASGDGGGAAAAMAAVTSGLDTIASEPATAPLSTPPPVLPGAGHRSRKAEAEAAVGAAAKKGGKQAVHAVWLTPRGTATRKVKTASMMHNG